MHFRNDINALRAIAVIAVVLFHFNSSWLPGGFAGVDVFFVISGFLMTGIIFRGLENSTFSIWTFYIARANRIIPALAVLCLTLLVFGWFFLNPIEYKSLGNHVGNSLVFVSNLTYAHESGYFNASAHEKWLLHTWSLSVEWQFYILFPLLLLLLRRWLTAKTTKIIVLAITVISFIFCLIASMLWPEQNYFILPSRVWEMTLGGVVYLYPLSLRQRTKRVSEWLGMALLTASFLFISEDNAWPGYWTLLPVAGAFLLLHAQSNSRFLTSNILFQKIGKWSYSIYLWHWPVVVAMHHFSIDEKFIVPGIAVSVFLGYLSFNYIETITFNRAFTKRQHFWRHKPLSISLLVSILGFSASEYEPNKFMYPIPDSVISSFTRGNYECFDKDYRHSPESRFCAITAGETTLFATGDSHLYSVLPVIETISNEQDIQLTYASYSGCPPLVGIYPSRPDQLVRDCSALNDKVSRHIAEGRYDHVFVAARWSYYTRGDYSGDTFQHLSLNEGEKSSAEGSLAAFKHGLNETFKRYSELDTHFSIMLQVPMQVKNAHAIYYDSIASGQLKQSLLEQHSVTEAKHLDFQRSTNQLIINEANKYRNITIIDPTEPLCHSGVCSVGNVSTSHYYDDDHLSVLGSYQLQDMISHAIVQKP